MYLYKPSNYNPERIGYEICYHDCLDHVKASINSFFLKDKYTEYYKWKLACREDFCWSLHDYLEPSFKKLTKIGVK